MKIIHYFFPKESKLINIIQMSTPVIYDCIKDCSHMHLPQALKFYIWTTFNILKRKLCVWERENICFPGVQYQLHLDGDSRHPSLVTQTTIISHVRFWGMWANGRDQPKRMGEGKQQREKMQDRKENALPPRAILPSSSINGWCQNSSGASSSKFSFVF